MSKKAAETPPAHPEFCGKVLKMTTENGEQKGLQQTLEERGFNVMDMRAKCSPLPQKLPLFR